MASWGKCDFSEFKAMADRFRSAVDTNAGDRFTREVLQELGNMLLASTKQRTPVDTGQLRRTWFITSVRQRGDMFEIEIYNNTEYAPWVENGHRVVVHGQTVGWCEGFFMLRLSVMEIERLAPEVIGKRSDEFLKKLMEGTK